VLSSEDNVGASDTSVQISKENILADKEDGSSVNDLESQRKLEINEGEVINNDLTIGEKPPDEERHSPDLASASLSEFPDGMIDWDQTNVDRRVECVANCGRGVLLPVLFVW